MYQKSKGRSWELRKKSNELWPKWVKSLQQYNKNLKIEKPLIQLTTEQEKFEKLSKFFSHHPRRGVGVLEQDSTIIQSINKIFNIDNLKGIIYSAIFRFDDSFEQLTISSAKHSAIDLMLLNDDKRAPIQIKKIAWLTRRIGDTSTACLLTVPDEPTLHESSLGPPFLIASTTICTGFCSGCNKCTISNACLTILTAFNFLPLFLPFDIIALEKHYVLL
jgi:hypothetical protein